MEYRKMKQEIGVSFEALDEFSGEVPEETIVYDLDDENAEVL